MALAELGVVINEPLPAGTNLLGSVNVVNGMGALTETYAETATDVPKNEGALVVVSSAAIPDTETHYLEEVRVSSRLGMTAIVYADDDGTRTEIGRTYISGTGGQEIISFGNVAKNQLTGNVGQTVKFDVDFENNDRNQDAKANATFKVRNTA